MIRKTIIVLLTLAAVGAIVLDVISRQKALLYFSGHIGQPTFWKLRTAQAERGKLRVTFESLGEFVHITEQDLPSYDTVGGSPPPIRSQTLRDRLAHKGFYVGCSALWSYGGGEDDAGNYFNVKAMRRSVSFGVPAWFLSVLLASYPTLVFSLSTARLRRYRKRHGLCTQCGYNLTGNVSGVCPECGEVKGTSP